MCLRNGSLPFVFPPYPRCSILLSLAASNVRLAECQAGPARVSRGWVQHRGQDTGKWHLLSAAHLFLGLCGVVFSSGSTFQSSKTPAVLWGSQAVSIPASCCHWPFVLLSGLEYELFSPGLPGRCRGRSSAGQLGWRAPQRPLDRPRSCAAALETTQALEVCENRAAHGPCIPCQPAVRSSEQINPQTGTERAQRRPLGRRSWARGVCGALKIPVVVRKVRAAAAVPAASRAGWELRSQRPTSQQSDCEAL